MDLFSITYTSKVRGKTKTEKFHACGLEEVRAIIEVLELPPTPTASKRDETIYMDNQGARVALVSVVGSRIFQARLVRLKELQN